MNNNSFSVVKSRWKFRYFSSYIIYLIVNLSIYLVWFILSVIVLNIGYLNLGYI